MLDSKTGVPEVTDTEKETEKDKGYVEIQVDDRFEAYTTDIIMDTYLDWMEYAKDYNTCLLTKSTAQDFIDIVLNWVAIPNPYTYLLEGQEEDVDLTDEEESV